jgi:putative heme-binding domain-containing protein
LSCVNFDAVYARPETRVPHAASVCDKIFSIVRVVLLLFAAGAAFAAEEAVKKIELPTAPNDLARGEALFQGHCALCHGTKGDGGRGPVLAQPRLKRAADDTALVKVIEDGIGGTEMPGAWQMNEREIHQVASYVRSLGRVSPQPVPGDPARGAEIYRGKGGCVACHMIKGRGGVMGPDLDEVGARRSGAYLREALVNPEAALPDGFLQVRVVPLKGSTITGIRLGEDSFAVQLRDHGGRLHSYWKRDLKEIMKDRGKSPMPSYKDKLTDAELTDLVAYLASLREEQ